MNSTATQRTWDRSPASNLWRHTLSHIPSVFGRLAYLSSLRNANTDRYDHHGLAVTFGKKQSDHVLRQAHEKAFLEWLGFTLEKQKVDLDLHLSEMGVERRTAVCEWLHQPTFNRLIPESARSEERQLFLSDMGILLNLLQLEYGVSRPASAA